MGNTELGQLLKLPNLFSHYLQHHSINPDVGFIDFIVMHYIIDDDGSLADNQEDDQLPFHNFNYQHSFVQTLSHLVKFNFINLNLPVQSEIFVVTPQKELLTGYASLLLQPPRV